MEGRKPQAPVLPPLSHTRIGMAQREPGSAGELPHLSGAERLPQRPAHPGSSRTEVTGPFWDKPHPEGIDGQAERLKWRLVCHPRHARSSHRDDERDAYDDRGDVPLPPPAC